MAISIQGNNPYSTFYKTFLKGSSASKNNSQTYLQNEEINSNSLRREEYEQRMQASRKSVVEQSMQYAQQLSASRAKTNDAALEKKKLQYNFKKLSSQIVRSKNSVSARKAVQAAKREIMRLKRLKGSGEYDDEELQLAIEHAKSMEKVAKKKVSHLEQEEMIERHGKGIAASMEEIEKEKNEDEAASDDEELLEEENSDSLAEELDVDPEFIPEYDYQYQMQMMQDYMDENELSSVSEEMGDILDEFSQEMAEMMEDMDLTDLAESMYAPDPDMSEDDLKMLRIKHRGKELKEIAQADKEYLKGMIEHNEKKMSGMSNPISGFSSSGNNDKDHQIIPVISMPGAAAHAGMSAPMIEGSFNVSI